MSRRLLLLVLGSAILPALSLAQAPRITPQRDPSVKPDSIYALAVKAPESSESIVYLLDDGVARVEADGRGTTTYRQIVQVVKADAVDRWREQSFSWAPQHQKFTLNWVRVVKPNGEVVSAKPAHEQDADVPAQMGDPVYTDRKVKRISLTGVEPGAIVDYSYTTEELKPFLAGDFMESWRVTPGTRVMRSRFIVDVPTSVKVRIREENLNFPRQTREAGARTVYTWATQNLPPMSTEPFAADSNGVSMTVTVSSPLTWQDIGKWYATNARDRYTLSPPTAAKLTEVVATARTRDDTIRAVHRWVAQDIRYVSIALGLGGYQPRAPDTVFATGLGDCKDKATLFVASLAKLGITAYPVLLNADGGVKRDLPAIEQFDHAIAALPTPKGYQFVDLTSELTPYGELPGPEQGEFALVVHPDGSVEEATMPADSLGANRSEIRISGALNPDGTFDGKYEERDRGEMQYGLRDALSNPLDSAQKAAVVNSIASKYFEGAEGDSLVAFAGKDLSAQANVSLLIKHGKATSSAGNSEILTNPFGNMSGLAQAAKEVEARMPRRYPIDAEKIFGARVSVLEMRLRLPSGWKAQLPPNVSATSAFGSYVAEYAQTGDELRITRRTMGGKGIFAPEKAPELAQWFRAMAKDDARMIVINKN